MEVGFVIVAGIDEAGRGPVLGPLVLAVGTMHKRDEERLLEIGVRDSKLLSARERSRQYAKLKKCLQEYCTAKIEPFELDKLMDRKSLNEIEAMRAAQLLNELKQKPELVIVDSPDPIQENFARRIKKYISFDAVVRTEHKADCNHPIVSAASIIAKVERDREIRLLAKKHGRIGSGYPHDELTINFIKKYLEKNGRLPDFARKSWDTSQRLLDEKFQKKLF